MLIVKPSVEWTYGKPDGMKFLQAIELAGRTCYKSEDKITDDSCIKFVQSLIKRGHLAMIEHAPDISMRFVCDRGVTHEIVRHRLFSFAQESTRYCNYGKEDSITVILPCWFEDGILDEWNKTGWNRDDMLSNSELAWQESMLEAERKYLLLLSQGWTPQQARSVLPNSLKTEIVVKGNVREWMHFFSLRCAKTAHPQMREVAIMALKMCREAIPILFDADYGEKD